MAIHRELKKILVDILGINLEDITEETKLFDDLGADNFAKAELFTKCEAKFNVKISDELIDDIETVCELQYVISKLILGETNFRINKQQTNSDVINKDNEEQLKYCYLVSAKINDFNMGLVDEEIKFFVHQNLALIETIEELEVFILTIAVKEFLNQRIHDKKYKIIYSKYKWELKDYTITKL